MNIGLSIVSLFAAAALAVSAQSNPLQAGVDSFRQGEYEVALQQFQQAKLLRPNDAILENLIGLTETRLGHIDQANRDYESAIRLNPTFADPHKNLGVNYLQAGEYVQATAQLKDTLALNSGDSAAHYYLILADLSLHNDAEVIANIKAAQPLLANDSEAAVAAIKVCLHAAASAPARELTSALEQQSRFSAAQEYELAEAYSSSGFEPDAAQRFRIVLQMQPASWEAKYNLALSLARAKQTGEASRLLQSLSTDHPDNANVQSLVASVSEFISDSALAVTALEKAVAADPHNPDRYLDCTRLLMDLNRYDEADSLVREGLSRVQDTYPLTIRLGAIQMARGNHQAAEDQYRQAIRQHPSVALGYVALAQAFMKEGDDHQAFRVLTEGRSVVPPDFALEYALGLACSRLGQQQQAIEAFERSTQLNPEVVEPHFQLGLTYLQQGQLKESQEQFENVLRLDQTNVGACFQLSRIFARMGDKEKAQQMSAKAQELGKVQQDSALRAERLRVSPFQPQ